MKILVPIKRVIDYNVKVRVKADHSGVELANVKSALLRWSLATFVSKLALEGETARATREVDGGLENLTLKMPAVVTVDLRLNEPRYASLPNIMKAKKKPIDALTPDELGVDTAPRLKLVKVTEPPARKAGVIVADVAELVRKLKEEAKVI